MNKRKFAWQLMIVIAACMVFPLVTFANTINDGKSVELSSEKINELVKGSAFIVKSDDDSSYAFVKVKNSYTVQNGDIFLDSRCFGSANDETIDQTIKDCKLKNRSYYIMEVNGINTLIISDAPDTYSYTNSNIPDYIDPDELLTLSNDGLSSALENITDDEQYIIMRKNAQNEYCWNGIVFTANDFDDEDISNGSILFFDKKVSLSKIKWNLKRIYSAMAGKETIIY